MYSVISKTTCTACGALHGPGNICQNCRRPDEEPGPSREPEKTYLDHDDCLKIIRELARSQGFYGRLLRSLAEMKEEDPYEYANAMQYLDDRQYTDAVSFIMDIEG